jgi:hypothetical protein
MIRSSLDIPRHWNMGRLIFVNSMSDLFHETVPAVMQKGRTHGRSDQMCDATQAFANAEPSLHENFCSATTSAAIRGYKRRAECADDIAVTARWWIPSALGVSDGGEVAGDWLNNTSGPWLSSMFHFIRRRLLQ